MNDEHSDKVSRLTSEIKKYYSLKAPFKIYHGSTNSTRILSFKKSEMIDVSNFNQILEINAGSKTVIVEPNVPMDRLVDACLELNLVPPVIPEFPGITVGGAVQGGAGESSSFKHGFFSQTLNWIDYILPNGELVRASKQNNSDLFYGAAGSSGTLGVITAMEVKLMDAKTYVNVEYEHVDNYEQMVEGVTKSTNDNYDFIDGIMFASNSGMITRGVLSDKKGAMVQHFKRSIDPWYYLFVSGRIGRKNEVVSIPLIDYLFRYDRGAFWVGRYAFNRFGVPFNAFTRFLLNPILTARKLYQALQDSGASQEYIVQDVCLPLENAEAFIAFIDSEMTTYPLWICPVKPEPRSPLLCNGIKTKMVINVGVWGERIANYDTFIKQNKRLESKIIALKGKKWMYAHTYYTRNEFWKIYDKKWYEDLRKKYHATTLPSMYDKVVVKDIYSVNARRGLLKTIIARAKLRIEE